MGEVVEMGRGTKPASKSVGVKIEGGVESLRVRGGRWTRWRGDGGECVVLRGGGEVKGEGGPGGGGMREWPVTRERSASCDEGYEVRRERGRGRVNEGKRREWSEEERGHGP